VRDAVWLAVDDSRLTGIELWVNLVRRLPGPYNAATIGDHVGSCSRVGILVETNPYGQDPTPTPDTPSTSPVTSVTLVRKPHYQRDVLLDGERRV